MRIDFAKMISLLHLLKHTARFVACLAHILFSATNKSRFKDSSNIVRASLND